MAETTNGQAPTDEAKRLASKDFTKQVATLAEERIVNRTFLRNAIGEFDPENIPLNRRYQMRKDPMIQMGLHYRKFPLIRAKWHIECEDPKIAGAVTEIVRRVRASYIKVMLNKFDFGYQGAIKQFALGELFDTYEDQGGNPKPVWDDEMVKPLILEPPLPLPPEYVKVKVENGKFAGIDAMLGGGVEDKDKFVPPEWAIWATNEFEENFRNYYGYPLTGYAYRYWWSYWFRFHMEDRHFEMDADPALQIKYPKGTSPDENGNPKNNRDLALEIGNALRGGATIAWPSEPYYDEQGKPSAISLWEAEFLQGGENLGAFRESSEYLDVMKLRSTLVPEQALVEGKGGTSSRNAAATYTDIFNESLGQEAEDLDWLWNRYIIPQVVEANWGVDAPRATLITSGFEDEDLSLAHELIKLAFTVDPNALPIDFDELLVQARLPVLSAKEQKEREKLLEEYQAQKMQEQQEELAAQQEAGPEEGGEGGEQNSGQFSLAFPQADVADDKKLFTPHLRLHQGEPKVASTAPEWAKIEHDRRESNLDVLAKRLQGTLQKRYEAMFNAVAEAIEASAKSDAELSQMEDADLLLAFKDRTRVKAFLGFYNRVKDYAKKRTQPFEDVVHNEVASMYHASGAAELLRLGFDVDAENWDVRNADLQEWATEIVDRMLSGTEATGLEIHIKPWLEEEFQGESYPFEPEPALSLAQKFRVHFMGYPRWMAQRTARTEARHAYNNAALDVWELSGIKQVRAYDGLGGVTGKTDPICLARNGKIYSIAEARREDAQEHPNGTLGFTPVIEETVITLDQRPMAERVFRSAVTYVMDSSGRILREEPANGV